ncbi:MAG: helix-hairpin-helix domain-containing protein [Tumebacillaceae bacterium]
MPWILVFALPNVWMASVVLAWLGSAFHAFRVRKDYLQRRAAIEAAEEQAQTPAKTVESMARPIHASRQRVLNNEEAPALATNATTTATASTTATAPTAATAATGVSTVSPDLVDSELVAEPVEEEPVAAREEAPVLPAHPIDLNKATEAEFALLPGVGEILAMRAVSEREVRGGFRSVEEFIKAIGLRPEVIERIRPYAFVTPKQ